MHQTRIINRYLTRKYRLSGMFVRLAPCLCKCLCQVVCLVLIPHPGFSHGTARSPEAHDRAILFPDTADNLTLVVDLHTHSVFSDGHVWPSIRVAEAIADGLDAMAITEHLEWQPHLMDIPHSDRSRSFNEAVSSLPEDSDLILIAGSEITRSEPAGHINAVFINDANTLLQVPEVPEPFDPIAYYRRAGEWPAQEAVDAANNQGAFVFWNHSWTNFSNRKTRITEFHRSNFGSGKIHGIEIANGNAYSPESFQIALDHNLAPIGVSDVHNLIDWDYEPHNGGHRPVNLVFAKAKTSEAIRDALFAGRTVVWFKNLLFGRREYLMPLLSASVRADSASYRPDSEVLAVTLQNHSDAVFQLRNTSDYSLTGQDAIIELPAHAETTMHLRTGTRLEQVALSFEVLNALTAPGQHPILQLVPDITTR